MVRNSTGRSQKEPQVRETKGAASSLAADRAESWTGRCCETTPRNLSQGHCSQCCFLLLQRIPHSGLSSCLPHPGGNSQPFLLSSSAPHLTILLPAVSVVALAPTSRLLPAVLGRSCASSPWVPVLQLLGSAQPRGCLWSGR